MSPRSTWLVGSGTTPQYWKPCESGVYDVYVSPALDAGQRAFTVSIRGPFAGNSVQLVGAGTYQAYVAGAGPQSFIGVQAEPDTTWVFEAAALAVPGEPDGWSVYIVRRSDTEEKSK